MTIDALGQRCQDRMSVRRDPAFAPVTDRAYPTEPFPANTGQQKGTLTKRQRGRDWTRKIPLRGSLLRASSHYGDGRVAAELLTTALEREAYRVRVRHVAFHRAISRMAACMRPRRNPFEQTQYLTRR